MSSQNNTVVMADDNLKCLVVDDNPVNLTMAQSFLLTHNIRADLANSGAEALRLIEEKTRSGSAYDIVFMDHRMPEMDGIETVRRIRELENAQGKLPVIAMTASAAARAKEMYIEAGMNDFIGKPIVASELRRVLERWLPAGLFRLEPAHSNAAAPADRLLDELAGIKGFDVKAGLGNFGQRAEGFYLALRLFSRNCDSYIEEFTDALKAENWESYTIKAHALKGVLAAFGLGRLSQWAANLEKASSKNIPQEASSLETCREETAPFCAALVKFRDTLLLTSLFNSNTEGGKVALTGDNHKPKGEEKYLREQIENLKKGCIGCSFEEIEKILTELSNYNWGSEIGSRLEKIYILASSYNFEEALEKTKFIE